MIETNRFLQMYWNQNFPRFAEIRETLQFNHGHDFQVYHLYSYLYVRLLYTVRALLATPGEVPGFSFGGHRRSSSKDVLSAKLTLSTIRYQFNVPIVLI